MIKFIKKLRNIFLRKIKWRKYSIGKNFHAGRGVFLWAKNNICIGKNFYIGKYSIIECNAEIGDNVIFANHVSLIGKYDHNYQQIGIPIRLANQIRDENYKWKGLNQKIIINDDVWIGLGSIILSGIEIGEGSIIAAGSVVTKDVEPFSIYGGNPAKKICNRFNSKSDLEKHKKIYKSKYKK
jgi:acetyltransferase-like isoleucine patch superfamily enzyme